MKAIKIALITIIAISFVFSLPIVASSEVDRAVYISVIKDATGEMKTMKITIQGNVARVTGQDEEGEVKDLKLGEKTLINVPDGTIIETHGSPGCYWYFYRGKWYKICS